MGQGGLEASSECTVYMQKTQRLEEKSEVSYIQFHLHGGTGYGRGITVLPENHRDVKELKAFLESVDLREYASSESPTCQEPEDSYLTLGSCSEGYQRLSVTVLTDHQHFDVTTVNTILNSRVPQQYRIRAKLRKFEPKKLYQSVKLLCPQCNSLQAEEVLGYLLHILPHPTTSFQKNSLPLKEK
uniref:Uncharacterized protein n=1 Tax=Sphaerodactylus townsendi TaxID=933632 RepID=A0ACB8FQJ4_9SAUR